MKGFAAAAFGLMFAAASAWGGEPYLLSADATAAGVQQLSFSADAGEVKVTASKDDAVHVKLDLHQDERSFLGLFRWMSDTTARDLAGATLKLQRNGSGLALSLVYPSGDSHGDVKQRWTLALPARLRLVASLDAGRMVIEGVEGGLDARVDAGDLTIRSPMGPVHGRVDAGRLHVSSDTATPGAISIGSTFGLAVLSLNGQYFGPPEKHGMLADLHFLGNSVVHASGGKDDMDLKVTAGLVDLRVGPLGDEKTYRELFKAE